MIGRVHICMLVELFPKLATTISIRKMTFTDKQLLLIADAVEDYALLIDEDAADECGEILDIIEAHFLNKKFDQR